MLVGVIGFGKSMLVDGIVNYILGVYFDDLFRFVIVQLEEEENKVYNQVFCINVIYYLRIIYVFKKYYSKIKIGIF